MPVKKIFFLAIVLQMLLFSCKTTSTGEVPPNPFDDFKDTTHQTGPVLPYVDPKSFAGIHQTVFSKTCANSGCHDGNFEPDFRTIESSYNTLVLRSIIKNNPGNTYQYRVVPGNSGASVLWERLNNDIDGQSGIMPLVIDPNSDWETKKGEYLNNIKAWIEGGAKDMLGNSPVNGNLQPYMKGVIAFPVGNTSNPLSRDAGSGAIQVPAGMNSIDIWLAFGDDNTPSANFQNNKIRFSTNPNGFAGLADQTLSILSPLNYMGYFGTAVDYTHKITVNLSGYTAGSQVFFRAYIKDPQLQNNTEIPADGSANYVKDYFSLKKG